MYGEKSFCIYIRHHQSTRHRILIAKGLDVIRIINTINRITKSNLPQFRVDLKVTDNNNDIFKLDNLFYLKIKVELPRKMYFPPRCKKCYSYLHTVNYWQNNARRVKCGEGQLSSDCEKSHVKCALCSGPHTMLYKRCLSYKNIMLNRSKHKASKNNKI